MLLTLKLLLLLLILFILFMIVCVAFLLKFIIKTAPKDIQERLKNRENPPLWKSVIGIVLALMCLTGIIWILVYAGINAIETNMTLWQIFLRYLILFVGYKLFDIIVFDWLLLTKLNIYQHFFPEIIGCESMQKFGFNFKNQVIKIFLFIIGAFIISLILSNIA